jgi:hypothetical protein
MDSRLALLTSVGLTVLAPSPVACELLIIPGITDIRFAEEDGVFVLRPGCLLANDDDLLCSGVLIVKCACSSVEGGCRDLVFAALDIVSPRPPSVYFPPFPILSRVETAASDKPCADEFETRLGRRLCPATGLA